jgi:hypothetical protein
MIGREKTEMVYRRYKGLSFSVVAEVIATQEGLTVFNNRLSEV